MTKLVTISVKHKTFAINYGDTLSTGDDCRVYKLIEKHPYEKYSVSLIEPSIYQLYEDKEYYTGDDYSLPFAVELEWFLQRGINADLVQEMLK